MQMRLKDLGNLSNATTAITDLMNSGVTGNKALASTLSLLNTEQKIAAVSQLSLTEAQKLGILATSGLSAEELKEAASKGLNTSSITASTASINLNTMTKVGNTAATTAQITEETKSLLVKGGLITEEQLQAGATVQVTSAKVADAVATNVLTAAEGKQIITTLGLTGATTGLSVAMKGLWATLKANPIILAVAAVTVGIMAFKNFKESQEEARRAAQEAAHTYDTKSCLELLDNYKSTLSSVRISLIFDSVLLA